MTRDVQHTRPGEIELRTVAAATAASSLSVVGNANRLRRYHPAALPATPVAEVTPQVETGSATASRTGLG